MENRRINARPTVSETEEMIQKLAATGPYNIYTNLTMMVGSGKVKRQVLIYLTMNEPLKETLKESYCEYTDKNETYAWIGEDNRSYVDHGYISVDDVEVKVAGILENDTLKND